MDKHQLNLFKSAFKRANYGKISMPNRIDISKIYDIDFYPPGMMRGGCKVRFVIRKDENGHYSLELLAVTDSESWHKRIEHDGRIVDLENYISLNEVKIHEEDPEQTERERQKIRSYNESLRKELIRKGLEQDTDRPEFERDQVITIRNYGF